MKTTRIAVILAALALAARAYAQVYPFFPPPGYNCAPAQVPFSQAGNTLLCTSNLTWNNLTDVLNVGASTTPGTFSVGQLDTMIVNGVQVPIPGFALNSNIQGVIENHAYVPSGPSGGARYYGVRSRGSWTSPAIVQNGDRLATFYSAGYNGTSYSLGGQLQFTVDGTPGAAAMPTDACLSVSAAGAQVPTERFCAMNDGSFRVNGSVGTSGQVYTSGGPGAPASWTTVGGGGVTILQTIKATDTSRNNTTTATADPDLSFAGVASGAHSLECLLLFTQAAAAGFEKFAVVATANLTSGQASVFGADSGTIISTQGNAIPISAGGGGASDLYGNLPASGSILTIKVAAGIVLSGTSTIAIYWAQNASNNSPTILQAGSWCHLT